MSKPRSAARSMDRIHLLQRLMRYGLTLVIFVMLAGLGSLVMRDMARLISPAAMVQEVEDSRAELEAQLQSAQARVRGLSESEAVVQRRLESHRQQLSSYEADFNAWRALRSTTGDAETNPELRSRLQRLDALRQGERSLLDELNRAVVAQRLAQTELADIRGTLQKARETARAARAEDSRDRFIKAFFVRLAVVLPVLLLGVIAFVRYRNHRYSPIAWGFILFSLYVFFVQLLPYLPSFGGYLRYGVGLILSITGVVYAIRSFQAYLDRKRAEIAASAAVRAERIGDDLALTSFRKQVCPSCQESFTLADSQADFCFNCGISLFTACKSCGHRGFTFFRHCTKCGCTRAKAAPSAFS